MEELSSGTIAALGGLAGGMVLGFAARWGRFCTLGAIEDAIFGSSKNRLRMWGLAIAVAIAGTFILDLAGIVDLESSFYLRNPVSLLSTIAGGLMFGLGMAFVGTCGYGMLARIGGGDLKSVVTFLVMGASAYAAVRGITAYVRVVVFPMPDPSQSPWGIAHTLASVTGVQPFFWAMVCAASLALFCLAPAEMRANGKQLATAAIVGLSIVSGWYVTGSLATTDFESQQLASFTFSLPLGESLVYLMTMTGASLKFGIGAVAGVVLGAFLTAIVKREFRWEACDDVVELRRQMLGGFLMGTGGVLALGCTVGQGLSAASLLAWSAPVALCSIFIGAWLGLHYLIGGNMVEPVRALFSNANN